MENIHVLVQTHGKVQMCYKAKCSESISCVLGLTHSKRKYQCSGWLTH
jgi:hypothetical protein